MKIAHIILLFLFVGFCFKKSISQIEVTPPDFKLKDYTLYVQIKDSIEDEDAKFMQRLKETWTITKLVFYEDRFEDMIDEDAKVLNAGIGIESTTVTHTDPKTHMSSSTEYKHWYFKIYRMTNIVKMKKGIEYQNDELARVALFDPRYVGDAEQYVTLTYGLELNYLIAIQECFKNKIKSGLYRSKLPLNASELANLQTKKLYVPAYAFQEYSKWKGTYSEGDVESTMSKYKFKYKVISGEDLSNKILDADKDFYYMLYIRSCTDKYIMIVNGKTGAILYTTYKGVSYNLKSKDLAKVGKAVKKG